MATQATEQAQPQSEEERIQSLPFTDRLMDLIIPKFRTAWNAFIDSDTKEIWLKGGRGSTKSTLAAYMLVLGILSRKDCCAIAFRRTQETVRGSIYNQVQWAISKLSDYFPEFIKYEDFIFRTAPAMVIHAPTGNAIVFHGMDDERKKKSIKAPDGKYFGYLWCEEVDEFENYEKIASVKASVLRGGGIGKSIFTFNPPMTNASWVNMECNSPMQGRKIFHANYLDVMETHPEWLGEIISLANRMKERNERHYRWEYLGEVTGTGGTVFQNLTIREITNAELAMFDDLHYGCDFGYTNAFAFVACAWQAKRRRLFIFDEIFASRMLPSEACAEIKKRDLHYQPVMADCEDPNQIAQFNGLYNVYTLPVRKGADSRRFGYRSLQGLDEIVIDPVRAPNTAYEFQKMEFERDRKTGEFVDDYPKIDDHAIDAVRYAMEKEFKALGLF